MRRAIPAILAMLAGLHGKFQGTSARGGLLALNAMRVERGGHGSRRGNKPTRDYALEKRRRQIARASRQLNRRRRAA